MGKPRQTFLLLDTETSQTGRVADFAALVVRRSGEILNSCAVLVDGVYNDPENHPLFFSKSAEPGTIWSTAGQDKRYKKYRDMLANGNRMMASVPAINRWLERARGQYDPVLTAYNLAFDSDKCANTNIDLSIFSKRFCLWYAAVGKFATGRKYRKFVLNSHRFTAPTGLGNMAIRTDADTMARFCLNDPPDLPPEPHDALGDLLGYELPVLTALTRRMSLKDIIATSRAYDWRKLQVKDHFTPV